ncbi:MULTISPECIES: pilus assembly protein TadG-related protein [unclassified Brachybacterium]|uniref:pilus assembly protein TadG-related protein n=1 Tax=unclassified Brachybacterium TaxID=2623841 RepID=UPI000C7FBD0D|nr:MULTISPECIES: pilus assembly protein TadG-related protein [unclassified Brachybacterium]PMC76562.1 hypothetical protein CJ197_02085 [Brachybacterium sp. UMB0905]
MSEHLARLRERIAGTSGSMTILTTGVLVVLLMVIAVGTAVTGVQLERNGLQHAADAAALAASQAVDPSEIYRAGEGSVISPPEARQAAADHLAAYPLDSDRVEGVEILGVTVAADGTVHVVLAARAHPPLLSWFSRETGMTIPLTVTGEARAR